MTEDCLDLEEEFDEPNIILTKSMRKELLRFCLTYGYDYIEEDPEYIILKDTLGFACNWFKGKDISIPKDTMLKLPIEEVYGFLKYETRKLAN